MRHAIRTGVFVLTLVIAAAAAARSSSAQASAPGPALIKLHQKYLLAQEPLHERQEHREALAHARELRRQARRLAASGKAPLRARGAHARPTTGEDDVVAAGSLPQLPRGATRPAAERSALALGINVRCNDPSGDVHTFDGQAETAIVRWNNYLVASWNDGKGFADGTHEIQGWGTSVDGGVTWVDQGTLPLPAAYPAWQWLGDPVLAVNPTTGAFYCVGLAYATASLSAVGVVKGRFVGASFVWDPVSVVRTVPVSTDFLDKEWFAVDPADGRAYVSYSNFGVLGSEIDFQFADSSLSSWSTYQMLSDSSEAGWVQGSRPAVGAGGQVDVVYSLIGQTDQDYVRIARSSDRGVSFAAPNTAASLYSNWGTGAPGFNRPQGIHFPSVAVDRSGGAHDGRIYVAWNESLNWYDDMATLGTGASTLEVEPNDGPAIATPAAIGQVLRGSMASASELDYYRVSLAAGQGILVAVDSLGSGEQVRLRMIASDGATRLAYLAIAQADLAYGPAVWLFTAPASGTYYILVSGVAGSGPYRVLTGPAARTTERGRDQRDVFTAYSDDGGLTWSTPARVNNDPAGYDDWLPEIAVTASGQVGCAWYDWRDAGATTCGGESSIYLAASANGDTWREQGPVTDVRSAWTSVLTNIVPNQGDYFSLFADGQGYAVAWADGRDLNPNVYMAAVPLATAGVADLEPAAFRLAASTGLASARFAFDLPGAGRTRLAIFDLQGRKVATLVDGPLGAGSHAANWDLAGESGQHVGAGIYWALLDSGGRRASARMVVLR